MEEQFVTNEIALELKKLGFIKFPVKIENNIRYNNDVGIYYCPLWQQVIDWFREKYNININIRYYCEPEEGYAFSIIPINHDIYYDYDFKSYEECREQAIIKTIDFLKTKKFY